jgi:hypothetical protein
VPRLHRVVEGTASQARRPPVPGAAAERHGQQGLISDIFGKKRGRIFDHLGIRHDREDYFAARMTVSTALLAAGAPDFVRQAILGHEQNQIINRHYTEANLGLLKKYLDQIDLGLEIAMGPAGFPVIVGCSLLQQKALEVMLQLDTKLRARRIEVRDPETDAYTLIESQLPEKADAGAAAADMERMGVALVQTWPIVPSASSARSISTWSASWRCCSPSARLIGIMQGPHPSRQLGHPLARAPSRPIVKKAPRRVPNGGTAGRTGLQPAVYRSRVPTPVPEPQGRRQPLQVRPSPPIASMSCVRMSRPCRIRSMIAKTPPAVGCVPGDGVEAPVLGEAQG